MAYARKVSWWTHIQKENSSSNIKIVDEGAHLHLYVSFWLSSSLTYFLNDENYYSQLNQIMQSHVYEHTNVCIDWMRHSTDVSQEYLKAILQ